MKLSEFMNESQYKQDKEIQSQLFKNPDNADLKFIKETHESKDDEPYAKGFITGTDLYIWTGFSGDNLWHLEIHTAGNFGNFFGKKYIASEHEGDDDYKTIIPVVLDLKNRKLYFADDWKSVMHRLLKEYGLSYKIKRRILDCIVKNKAVDFSEMRKAIFDPSYLFNGGGSGVVTESFSEKTMDDFIKFCKKELHIKTPVTINLRKEKGDIETLANYDTQNKIISIYIKNRMQADIMRSVAHELVHHKQNEKGMELSGKTGSKEENEANAKAGILMRKFGQDNKGIYEGMINEITQEEFYDFYGLSLLPPNYKDEEVEALKRIIIKKIKDEYIKFLTEEVYDEMKTTKYGIIYPDDSGNDTQKLFDYWMDGADSDDYNDGNGDFDEDRAWEHFDEWANEYGFYISRNDINDFESATGITYKQVKEAQKNPEKFTLEQIYKVYKYYPFPTNYGGPKWAEITKALISLKNSKTINDDIVWIDHIHDLEHNTGNIFRKHPEFYNWIKKALEHKKKAVPKDLLAKMSHDVRKKVSEYLRIMGGLR